VVYEGIGGGMSCSTTADVTEGTEKYVTMCVDGVAEVGVFVRDSTFSGLSDITGQIPLSCDASKNEEDKKKHAMFMFLIPCDSADEKFCGEETLCPDIEPAPTSAPTSEPMCVQEARLDGDSTGRGSIGMYGSNPIHIEAQNGSTVSFNVDQTWKDGSVSWISVMYETSAGDMECAQNTNIVEGTGPYTVLCLKGVAEIAVFVRDSTFSGLADIYGQIPPACEASKESEDKYKHVMFFFTIPCTTSDLDFCPKESLCPDSVAASVTDAAALDDQEDDFHLTTNVITCGVAHEEKFDTPGDVESWDNGVDTTIEGVGSFLGRFGHENPMVQKTFVIPTAATKAVLSFTFMDIQGVVHNGDKVEIGIQNSWMQVDLTNDAMQYHKDAEVLVQNKNKYALQLEVSAETNAYTINIEIHSTWWTNHGNTLPIGFRVTTAKSIEEESYGISDFSLGVECDRRLDDQSLPDPEMEPSDEGEDGSFYCKAADYPCGDGNDMVHVCHFSSQLGYQTFCIPEADSEVLRFYSKDYCGPCVGGFGGINLQ
jgi:hypothetical protein